MHMIRKLFLAAPVAAALALSGCATGGVTATTIATTVADVQQAAVLACGFLPTASTVANILAAGNPLVSTATAVAQAICTAITVKAARRGGSAPMVGNVVIHGRFVK